MAKAVIPNRPKPSENRDINAILADFDAITEVVNGKLNSTDNLEAGGIKTASYEKESVTEEKLSKAVQELLNSKTAGGETKKFTGASEQTRENTAYGLMPVAGQVEIVLPENGLLLVGFQASWKSSASGAGSAAIFLGSNQLKAATLANAPAVQEVKTPGGAIGFSPLGSYTGGLASSGENYGGDIETGQIYGTGSNYGFCAIFAAAGTYKIGVQFKSSSGSVSVKNRKLWALAIT